MRASFALASAHRKSNTYGRVSWTVSSVAALLAVFLSLGLHHPNDDEVSQQLLGLLSVTIAAEFTAFVHAAITRVLLRVWVTLTGPVAWVG